ncbi:MAG: DUF5058 family protein [Acholeplasmatales bacterium]|nr:MAG: DUF5058 family protein [Acholeplasmatales bacterium]
MDFMTAWWMFMLGGLVVLFVISQSWFFMRKAFIRAQELGMERSRLIKVISGAMVFSIAPSVAILLGLLALSKTLGIVIPWIRLSVLGAVTYELPATINVVEGVFGASMSQLIGDPQIFVTVVWVMTFGVLPPLIIIPLFLKRIQGRVQRIQARSQIWGDMFMNAMFIGMISAFLGYVVAPRVLEEGAEPSVSLLAISVFVSSAVIMAVCGLLITRYRQNWLKNYAIPFSMLGSMGLAVLYYFLGVR